VSILDEKIAENMAVLPKEPSLQTGHKNRWLPVKKDIIRLLTEIQMSVARDDYYEAGFLIDLTYSRLKSFANKEFELRKDYDLSLLTIPIKSSKKKK
jgi:hypothetical protein